MKHMVILQLSGGSTGIPVCGNAPVGGTGSLGNAQRESVNCTLLMDSKACVPFVQHNGKFA
jgi:hypothetical protein